MKFAQWAIVYPGQFFDNDKSGPTFMASFYKEKSYVLLLV
jgi:hypothetical protein